MERCTAMTPRWSACDPKSCTRSVVPAKIESGTVSLYVTWSIPGAASRRSRSVRQNCFSWLSEYPFVER